MTDKSIDQSSFEPIETRPRMGGTQKLYRFNNGYGASVIRGSFSHGGDQGLWELGVIVWEGEQFALTYETPITNDVIGHLPEAEVDEILGRIQALPVRSAS